MKFTSEPITHLFQILILLILIRPTCQNDGIIITQEDYNGLQAFKHSISDPRGFLRSWNGTGIGACSGFWAGIKCVRGKVIAISLPWRGLGGHITEKIGQLTALRKLSLHDNAIGGQIPTAIGFLRDLRGVYLFNNEFSGSIPPSIGNCILLQALDLSNNVLTGSIPSEISNSTRLYRLNLSYNNLSGSVPDSWEGGRGSGLRILNLGHNFISGKIPFSLSRLKKLEELVLSHNLINGSIPKEIGNLSMLQTIDLSNDDLSGEIPSTLDHLANLTSFNVSYNNLSGPVPILLSNKFNSSSFIGNIHLCGFSVLAPCPSPNLPSRSTPSESKHHKLSTKIVILIAAGIATALLILLCCLLICCLMRKKTTSGEKSTEEKQVPGEKAGVKETKEAGGKLVHFDGPSKFSADDLLCATAEILGKSTYGTVYKATLEDGSQVAVKRLREKYAKSAKEFESEVNMLGKVRHVNVLELRAYYMGPKGEKLLVFDYMPKGNLATFLHARGPDSSIDWRTRLNIAIGTSRAISYLHNTSNIIHGNLTSNNILLEENTNPKIADFALSRLMTPTANSNAIAAAAALGYRAPELHNIKKAGTKTDVYSLGVVMLELLTGKSPGGVTNNGVELTQWVASVAREEWSNEVFDAELLKNVEENGDQMVEVLELALQCVNSSPVARPEVEQLLRRLEELASIAIAETSTAAGETSTAAAGD